MSQPAFTDPAGNPQAALDQALARVAAMREILEVISQNPENVQPVFEVIVRNAARLCETPDVGLHMVNAARTHIRLACISEASGGVFSVGQEFDLSAPYQTAIAIREARVIHNTDIADDPLYTSGDPVRRRLVDVDGVRSRVSVPLLKNGVAFGCINLNRHEVRPFTSDEIMLIETFAAQAVIAIENVRQFRELQASLEQQEATSEILRVISQSREDETQVFDLILEKAAVLCNADQGGLVIVNEARTHVRLMADWGHSRTAWQPGREFSLDLPLSLVATIRTAKVVHIEDYSQSDAYRDRDPIAVDLVETEGHRTRLIVPLLQNGIAIGCISLSRRSVRPFTLPEIQIVETFAAQAVIAIENVRQFRELQDRLAREAASRQILQVISQSRDDETPVFDAILEHAERLCDAPSSALLLVDDARSHLVLVATRGMRSSSDIGETHAITSGHTSSDAVLTRAIAHVHDVRDTDLYRNGDPLRVEIADTWGLRTSLAVPLIRGGVAIGAFTVMRLHKVSPFSANDISLLEAFAAQAVIAIENVRQFRALQMRLEREAATRNVLRVISESPDDEQPTFEAILDSATRLCGTQYASLVLARKGDVSQRMVAHRATVAETLDLFHQGKVPMDPEDSIGARAILEGRTIHVPDMADTDQYRSGHPRFRVVVDQQGLRTNLFVPLIAPAGGIGCFILWKKEVAPFTGDQIALMETFASHAVIAIENVRQFKALAALNTELGDRVQAQVGEIERMGRLKRFLPAAVADAVISSGSENMLKSHRALLGVLFCDIRGFTAFCETAEPEETIEVLQTYHTEMGKLIAAHGAGVDHRMGDGIMVLFNDPLPCDDPAGRAVRLGMAMRDRMADLCAGWQKLGHRLGFGVGISLGYATVGMVGAGGRTDYTASGTAINLASRLSDAALDGEILLSPRARLAVEGAFDIQPHSTITLKGIGRPVEVFCVTGPASA